jgi:prepilin peptidase CpaA
MMQVHLGAFAGPTHGAVSGAVFTLLLGAVCVSDLRTRRIPNTLVLVIAVLGTAFSVASAPLLPGLGRALGGLGLGLALWFPFYLFGVLGAGDVKFFAAASAWIGAGAALQAALLSALAGGVMAIVWLIVGAGWRRAAAQLALHAALPSTLAVKASNASSGHKLPYGLAMAVGLALAAWFPNVLRPL